MEEHKGPNIYIRNLTDREVIRTVLFTDNLSQRALEKCVLGLARHLDTTQHFVDTSEVDLAIAKRRR